MQIGATPLLGIAGIWLFATGHSGMGIFVGPITLAVTYTLLES